MFAKILIANRGEIACRIIETCDRLGVATVAIHSDIDATARHVAMADEAVSLGGKTPAESYLLVDRVIEAARATGAQAIHPGYGFLSENPDFVDAVEAAGLIFIGPSAKAIRAMGLKDAAKALMEKAGVPVVPGYHGADQSGLAEQAAQIGYPVLIKAVAGGGGKGMRRVDQASDFNAALASAQSEARNAFGNDAVLIEKYVEKPRHIELQIFGDGTDAVHLFERDCSLQRRHQKVIEEAPAPGMTDEMRAAMGEAATRAAKAVGYSGAGTVEFIVDASDGLRPDRFYFMEMNTRLQVEHPVTEAITGVDLVEWQLRVASGEPLPARQDQLSITGHSFEARLYAEDVPAGFLPATGTLAHLDFPRFARIDTGVRQGDEISPYYDPMIAKLTTHAATRDDALAALERALAQTQIAGTVTNIAFLGALARNARFANGDVDTGLIEAELDELIQTPEPCAKTRALAAIASLDPSRDPLAGLTLWDPLEQALDLDGHAMRVRVLGPDRFEVFADERWIKLSRQDDSWSIDGQKTSAAVIGHLGGVSVFWGGHYHFKLHDPVDREAAAGASDGLIRAPMPGLVKSVAVVAGESVEPGQGLAVLEAMKMEHTLSATHAGKVVELLCAPGAQVAAGDVLLRLDDE